MRKTPDRRTPARIAILCDLAEERWPSMDLVADMLMEELRTHHGDSVAPEAIRPGLTRRFSGAGHDRGARFNADRLVARMWDYPRQLARQQVPTRFDLFH